MKTAKIILIMGLIGIIAGCSLEVKTKNEIDLGSHHVIVKPPSFNKYESHVTHGDESFYEYTCGNTAVKIANEVLFVNNMKYGKLNAGDSVLVNNGKVFVNNQKRKGIAVSEKDIPKSPI